MKVPKIPKILKKHKEYLESTYTLTNDIKFSLTKTNPWDSKLGGCPYLENIDEYPMDKNGKPMVFLAQLNLEKMPALPDFPTKGLLQFYIQNNGIYGLNESCEIRYIPKYKKDKKALILKNPYREDYRKNEPFAKCCKLSFSQRKMPICTDHKQFEEKFCNKVSDEESQALYDFCYASGSRIGGYPLFVQSSPAYYDDGTADVLLLQLDVDDTSGLMFGDSGNCTFLISREDLLKRNFSNVEYDWQCC